jgi:hypothetical protein
MRMENTERGGFDSGFKVEVGGTSLLYQVMGLDDWAYVGPNDNTYWA